jgi:N-acetylglutamate synthase-like GNAT family acetyltransferase
MEPMQIHPVPRSGSVPASVPVAIRPAHGGDGVALAALLDRCSPDTLLRRFHGAVGYAVRRELERVAHPTDRHRSWVAVADGDIRGTATLAWGRDGTAEAAFLVEDAWFRRGIGRSLFGAVAREADRSGTEAVVAVVQADNSRARDFLRQMAPGARTSFAGMGEVEVVLPVPRPRASARLPRSQYLELKEIA